MNEMGGLRAAEREPGERRGRLRRRGARLHARRTRRRCAALPSVGAAPDSSRGLQRENAPGRVQGVAKVAAGRMRWRRRRQGGARRGADARATRAAGRRRGSAPAASTHSARQLQRLDEEGDHAARGTWREREPMPCSAQSHRRRRVTEPMDRRSRIPLRKRQGTAAGQSDRQLPCRLAEARLWTSHKRSVSSPAGQGKTVLGATRSECWGHAESAARARAKAPHLGEHETMIKPQLRRINRDELVQPK